MACAVEVQGNYEALVFPISPGGRTMTGRMFVSDSRLRRRRRLQTLRDDTSLVDVPIDVMFHRRRDEVNV